MNKNNTMINTAAMPRIEKIEQDSSIYPDRLQTVLKNKAPKNLYYQGNIDLFKLGTIGFCGSRKSSQRGIDTVRSCAKQAAIAGLSVVSGNATGIDFEAHFHALDANGSTILVLPVGINHFRIKRALEPVWDWERVLVISQFNPDDHWKAYRAMTRNQVIVGLSKAMVVIEAGEKGGTINAGTETLKTNTPLYVVEYGDMSIDARGNNKLLQLGGKRLVRDETTKLVNMKHIFDDLSKDLAISHKQTQIELL